MITKKRTRDLLAGDVYIKNGQRRRVLCGVKSGGRFYLSYAYQVADADGRRWHRQAIPPTDILDAHAMIEVETE